MCALAGRGCPRGAQRSCAGGLSQASFCLSCRSWFLGDRSHSFQLGALVLWGKVVTMTQNYVQHCPGQTPLPFWSLCIEVCVYISLYVLSCGYGCLVLGLHTPIYHVHECSYIPACVCVCLCVWLFLWLCVCQASPLAPSPAAQPLAFTFLDGPMIPGPRAPCPQEAWTWCLVLSTCHQEWVSLLFTQTPRVCLY